MYFHKYVAAMTLAVSCLSASGVHGQDSPEENRALQNDVATMRQLQNMLPPSERSLQPTFPIAYGPLVYRLSTAQGSIFESTSTPLIIRLNPDDGLSNRILGGIPAANGEFPWQVALLNARYGTLFCGGSHIGNGWIVTAAHCISDRFGQSLKRSDALVLVGTTNLTSGGKRLPLEQDPIFHEQYDPITKINDIALVKVASSALSASVSIPSAGTSKTQLTVSGWGATTEGGSISTQLLKVGVPVISASECKSSYPSIDPNLQICAGIDGRDSCQGDSGGPMSERDGSKYLLVGVVSYGKGCGRPGYPGVYTRASSYRDWIKQISGI